jgi:hypothetical protein
MKALKECTKAMLIAGLMTTTAGYALANSKVSLTTDQHTAAIQIDPSDLDESNILLDMEGGLTLHLPLDLGMTTKYRFAETVDSLGDVNLDKDYLWQTIEELAITGKILVTVKVGKIRDIGFGSDNTGIGSTASLRKYDDSLVQGQVQMRGKTGIQITAFDQLLPGEQKAVQYLRKALEGVTVTFFDPNSENQPAWDNFKNMEAFAVQKVGRAMGVAYQMSYLNADSDSVKDQRWSVSAHKCLARVCIGGEYIDNDKSDVSPYKNQARATVGTVIKDTDVAVQYTRNSRKGAAPSDTRGNLAEVVAKRKLGPGDIGASIGRDTDLDENVYGLNYSVKFGGKKSASSNSDMFRELREKRSK